MHFRLQDVTSVPLWHYQSSLTLTEHGVCVPKATCSKTQAARKAGGHRAGGAPAQYVVSKGFCRYWHELQDPLEATASSLAQAGTLHTSSLAQAGTLHTSNDWCHTNACSRDSLSCRRCKVLQALTQRDAALCPTWSRQREFLMRRCISGSTTGFQLPAVHRTAWQPL